jgi:hypothetical protein
MSERVRVIKTRDGYMLQYLVCVAERICYVVVVCSSGGRSTAERKDPECLSLAPFLNDSHVVVLPIVTIVLAIYIS